MSPFDRFAKDYKNKKVLIFGLGLQGRGVGDAIIFAQIGAQVRVTDLKTKSQLHLSISKLKPYPIEFTLGEHKKEDIDWADTIIRNASVPWNHELLKYARKTHKSIKMDACLFFEYTKDSPNKIGITGTRGKTTTTTLIHHIFQKAHKKSVLAGNIIPKASLQFLTNFDPSTTYIFELSSWQLQAFHQQQISPHYSIFTNIYPDHLIDQNFQQYSYDKTAIFAYQKTQDVLIANQQDKQLQKLVSNPPGKVIWFNPNQLPSNLKTKLKGDHNLENIAAAVNLCRQFGLDDHTIFEAISSFQPVSFRLQPVACINQVEIINDTTSTTPIALKKAISTYPNSILIMGGNSKNLPLDDIIETINSQVQAIILLPGTGTQEIKPYIKPHLIQLETSDLNQALKKALQLAQPNHTILFSPGFTSFKLFNNEFDRGKKFNQAVKSLT